MLPRSGLHHLPLNPCAWAFLVILAKEVTTNLASCQETQCRPNPSITGLNDVGAHGHAPLHHNWAHPGGVGVELALPAGRRPTARGRQAVSLQVVGVGLALPFPTNNHHDGGWHHVHTWRDWRPVLAKSHTLSPPVIANSKRRGAGSRPPHPAHPGWRKRRRRATLSPKGERAGFA